MKPGEALGKPDGEANSDALTLVAQGASAVAVPVIGGMVLSFVVTVALVRWLGADEFGTYSFVWSWVIVIGTASMFGLDRQLIRPRRAGG